MSYDIDFKDPETGECFEIAPHQEGGTIQVGGCSTTKLNVTYNYGFFFQHFLDKRKGIRWLYGKTGAEVVQRLEKAVGILGTQEYSRPDEVQIRAYREGCRLRGETPSFTIELDDDYRFTDYWAPTPGNAGKALNTLLQWAELFPHGVFSGD